MELKFLYPYKEMQKYFENISKMQNAWEEIMIDPYWEQIAEWAGNSCDFMKPASIKDKNNIKKQIEKFKTLDLSAYEDLERTKMILTKWKRYVKISQRVSLFKSD